MCVVSGKDMGRQVKSRSALASYVSRDETDKKRSDLHDP